MSNNSQMIDTHQHLWIISEREYSWLKPEYGVIYDDFGPELIEPQLAPAGVTGTVMVQSADTYADTFYMLDVAAKRTPLLASSFKKRDIIMVSPGSSSSNSSMQSKSYFENTLTASAKPK